MAVQQSAKRTPRHCKPQRRTGNTVVGISAKELTENCKQGLPKRLESGCVSRRVRMGV